MKSSKMPVKKNKTNVLKCEDCNEVNDNRCTECNKPMKACSECYYLEMCKKCYENAVKKLLKKFKNLNLERCERICDRCRIEYLVGICDECEEEFINCYTCCPAPFTICCRCLDEGDQASINEKLILTDKIDGCVNCLLIRANTRCRRCPNISYFCYCQKKFNYEKIKCSDCYNNSE